MCLILFAWQTHSRYPLVVAANRDEFHQRPSAAAAYWEDFPQLLAGRDLEAGGTWLGMTRQGRFAAVTNYREMRETKPHGEHSRGHLVRDFLLDEAAPADYAAKLQQNGHGYRGFSVLLGVPGALISASNRRDQLTVVDAGVHGLSNHLLDTDWPKVHSGRARLRSLLESDRLDPEAIFELLADPSPASGTQPPEQTPALAPDLVSRTTFIVSPEYGTRSSTVVLVDRAGKVLFAERRFNAGGMPVDTSRHSFRISPQSCPARENT